MPTFTDVQFSTTQFGYFEVPPITEITRASWLPGNVSGDNREVFYSFLGILSLFNFIGKWSIWNGMMGLLINDISVVVEERREKMGKGLVCNVIHMLILSDEKFAIGLQSVRCCFWLSLIPFYTKAQHIDDLYVNHQHVRVMCVIGPIYIVK